jgi:hypothetical protein
MNLDGCSKMIDDFFGYFLPCSYKALIFEAAGTVAKMGLNLKPNHRYKI